MVEEKWQTTQSTFYLLVLCYRNKTAFMLSQSDFIQSPCRSALSPEHAVDMGSQNSKKKKKRNSREIGENMDICTQTQG